MKIDGTTTLGQLAIRVTQLGIETITMYPLGIDEGYRVSVRTATEIGVGHAASMSEALDNAFERIALAIGVKL